jgi:hypothetical protein
MDEFQIEGLIRRGWLDRVERADRAAIRKALAFYLNDNLGDGQWARPKPTVTRNL